MKYKVFTSFVPPNAVKDLYSKVTPGIYEVIDIVDGRGILVNFLYMQEFIANRDVEKYGRLFES